MDDRRDIPGYEGLYAISTDGRVWSHHKPSGSGHRRGDTTGRWLKRRTYGSYPVAWLQKEKRRRIYNIHGLILRTFNPYCLLPGCKPLEGNHMNGIKSESRLDNLEWVTSGQNREHAWRTGLIRQTERRRLAGFRRALVLRKLSDEGAAQVRALAAQGIKKAKIAATVGVSRRAIYNILNGITYPVPEEITR